MAAKQQVHKRVEFKGEKSIKISSKGTKNIGLGIQDIGAGHFSISRPVVIAI